MHIGTRPKPSPPALASVGIVILLIGCGSTGPYIEALRGNDIGARREAAVQLQKQMPGARRALPELMRAAEDRDAELRCLAVQALGSMGKRAWSANVVLTAATRDKDVHVRRAAVVAMGKLGKFPTSAFPAFIACLGDPDSLVREFTMNTFEELGSNAVGTLVRALGDTCVVVRRSAAMTLGRLGEGATHAVSALQRAKSDQDSEVSRLAGEALKGLAFQ